MTNEDAKVVLAIEVLGLVAEPVAAGVAEIRRMVGMGGGVVAVLLEAGDGERAREGSEAPGTRESNGSVPRMVFAGC